MPYKHRVGGSSPSSCTTILREQHRIAIILCCPRSVYYMVSVVELVDTPDCGSGAAALRVQVSSSTPGLFNLFTAKGICYYG